MKEEPEVCRWWQRHQWGRWEMFEATVTNPFLDRETECLVQKRSCKRCGFSQIRKVAG